MWRFLCGLRWRCILQERVWVSSSGTLEHNSRCVYLTFMVHFFFLNHPDVYLDHKSTQGPTYCNISGSPHSTLLRIITTFLSLLRLGRWHTVWFTVTLSIACTQLQTETMSCWAGLRLRLLLPALLGTFKIAAYVLLVW